MFSIRAGPLVVRVVVKGQKRIAMYREQVRRFAGVSRKLDCGFSHPCPSSCVLLEASTETALSFILSVQRMSLCYHENGVRKLPREWRASTSLEPFEACLREVD